MPEKVKVGAVVDVGENISRLKTFLRCRLGNYVELKSHWMPSVNRDTVQQAVEFCRRKGIYFSFGEILDRYTLQLQRQFKGWTHRDWEAISRLGGDFFTGHHTMSEHGGAVYWPEAYCKGVRRLEECPDMQSAHTAYVAAARHALSVERSHGRRNFKSIDSSMLHRYHLEAGVDTVGLEVFPGDQNLLYSAIRGASRAYGRTSFDAHIAHAWYAGPSMDDLWLKRYKLALYYAYISGADPIYNEYGHFGLEHGIIWGKPASFNSSICRKYRGILRDFADFCQSNPRPAGGPRARIAVMHGQDDGFSGLWNRTVWGQFNNVAFNAGDPEESWALFEGFFRKTEWNSPFTSGSRDYSGNPPLGQVDVLPIEAPLSVMQKYSCIIFLGWNTMTEENYRKLKLYVSAGGHMVASVGHLNTGAAHDGEISIINNGDIRDLFGVRIEGRGPVVRNKGIKFVEKSSIPGYRFSNWTDKCDPKYMDGDLTICKLSLHGAKVIARVSGVFAPYQMGGKEEDVMPVLLENNVGRGTAFLVACWGYPATKGIRPFYNELLRVVSDGEQGRIKICGSDRVRYAVYKEKGKTTVYLLNTDMNIPQIVELEGMGANRLVTIGPTDLAIVDTKKE